MVVILFCCLPFFLHASSLFTNYIVMKVTHNSFQYFRNHLSMPPLLMVEIAEKKPQRTFEMCSFETLYTKSMLVNIVRLESGGLVDQ